jgi:hypothetical protein
MREKNREIKAVKNLQIKKVKNGRKKARNGTV